MPYNFEDFKEFKTWLEADESQKEGLSCWNQYLNIWEREKDDESRNFNSFMKVVLGEVTTENVLWNFSHQKPHQQVAKKWIAERERERAK